MPETYINKQTNLSLLEGLTSKEHKKFMQWGGAMNTKTKKEYEKPEIITYTEEEIMRIIGPAETCSSAPGVAE